jgi:hypothetical protein
MKTGINESQLDYQKPNIRIGIEYETGRLRDGKIEYGYLMDCGTIPSGDNMTKPHNLNINYGADPSSIRIDTSFSYIIRGDGTGITPIPAVYPDSGIYGIFIGLYPDTLNIRIRYGSAFSGGISPQNNLIYVFLTYTKTTDLIVG